MNPFSTTLEEEKANNNPAHSFRWVANNFEKTGLYRTEDITFANTDIIKEASRHFQKYGIYNDIDPKTDPIAFSRWWDRWEYRRKHGMVVNCKLDKSGGNSDKDLQPIWIPGKMVGLMNFGPILRTADPDDLTILDANTATLDQRKRLGIDEEMEQLFSKIKVNETADITHDFMDFWDGHFHYWVAQDFSERIGLDMVVVKARRKGFSYIGAWDAWDEVYMNPFISIFLVAYDMKYLTASGGLFSLVQQYFNFEQKYTDWRKRTLSKTKDHIKFGFTFTGDQEEYGFLSSITCFSAMDNPDCLRGKMAKKIKWEETGTFPNLQQTREIAYSAAEAGGYKLGHSTYWGTAGSKDGDYGPLRSAFYKPISFEALPFDNIWDINKEGTEAALFFGQLQNLVYDKDGNTDIEAGKQFHLRKTERARNSKTASQFQQWSAERATTPAEALNRQGDNIFSALAGRLQMQVDRLDIDPVLKSIGRCGRLEETTSGIRLITNEELKLQGKPYHLPINDTPEALSRDMDMHGCVVEWFSPHTISYVDPHDPFSFTGKVNSVVPKGLYYIWHDPYATDKDSTQITIKDSLGVAYVYEKANGFTPSKGDRIVASWIGRPDTTDGYNSQLLLLCKYYNTIDGLLFENDRGDVYPYFKHHKALRYLMEEPEMLTLKELSGKTGRNYGLSIGKNFRRKAEGARMLKDMLSSVFSKNQETNIETTFIEYIYCKRLLKELLRWNKDGNFDCVSACIVGQFMIREIEERETETEDTFKEVDDFFTRAHF